MFLNVYFPPTRDENVGLFFFLLPSPTLIFPLLCNVGQHFSLFLDTRQSQ